MATWAMRQRYAWIEARLAAGDAFNREDIVAAFTVTKQTASATLGEFQKLHPGKLAYDASGKVFVRSDAVAPPGLSRLERALLTALRSAESFMAGFEGDELQDGIDERLGTVRAAIAQAEGRNDG